VPEPHEILHVSPNATANEIEAAYRRLRMYSEPSDVRLHGELQAARDMMMVAFPNTRFSHNEDREAPIKASLFGQIKSFFSGIFGGRNSGAWDNDALLGKDSDESSDFTPVAPRQIQTPSSISYSSPNYAESEQITNPFVEFEISDTYKKIAAILDKRATNARTCVICNSKTTLDSYIALSNGARIHSRCYQCLRDNLKNIKAPFKAKLFFAEHPEIPSVFNYVNIHWPSYPHDWDSRRQYVLEYWNHWCKDCGEDDGIIQVHHINPLSSGGNNSIENLEPLCETCHQERHGHILGTRKHDGGKTHHQKKVEQLQRAIDDGSKVSFHYRKRDGEESDREISPEGFTRIHGVLCVYGHCHLRNSDRTFNVRRISKLRIV